jgi:hypothetical protein
VQAYWIKHDNAKHEDGSVGSDGSANLSHISHTDDEGGAALARMLYASCHVVPHGESFRHL